MNLIVDKYVAELTASDQDVLGVHSWREGLTRGFAAHHAGLLPAFRHAVEELFVKGLVKVVFATETLALGINMPARSVVLERLIKYNGESHNDLTPGEYTQLTGPGRTSRHRCRRPRRGRLDRRPRPRPRRRTRGCTYLPVAQFLCAGIQHGCQPDRPSGTGRFAQPAGPFVRAVPGRPIGGRTGPADRHHSPPAPQDRGGTRRPGPKVAVSTPASTDSSAIPGSVKRSVRANVI